MLTPTAELGDGRLDVVERLAVEPVLVLDGRDALALDRASDDDCGSSRRCDRLRERAVDLLDVVTVDRDRVPAERASAGDVDVEIPADHRLAALAQPVDVEDRGQVVELVVGRVLERLPHRAFGHLAVAAEHPGSRRHAVEALRGERRADPDREPLSERAGGDVDPGKDGRGMPLEPASELAVRKQLLVRDHARCEVEGVEQRRGVPLREDQPVVRGALRRTEVVAQVAVHEHRQQVGGGHGRRGMPGLRLGAHPDRIDPELLPQLAPALGVSHVGHSTPRFRVGVAR